MSNQIFDAFNKQNQNGLGVLETQFSEFAKQFKNQSNISPRERVQQLLDSGQMTQEQFNNLRSMANRLMGRNY